jgi:hypothetical protein
MRMKFLFLFGILVMVFGVVSANQFSGGPTAGFSGSTNMWQYQQPTFGGLYGSQIGDYWPILTRLESNQCNETMSDFIIGIPPGGCSPMVVRSDLLEEQNVPVFCQLHAIKVNPLIKVSSIRSISFKGDYPDFVSGVSFHPARAAVRSYTTLLGDPVVNNIGYVVIILKRNRVEANMPEWVAGNLTATIYYDAEEAFGTGKADYFIPMMSDDEWEREFERYSFWYGKGFLRVRNIEGDSARVDVMSDKDRMVSSFILTKGQTSGLMYFPGYYCRAGLRVRLNNVVAPENSALLNIDGSEFWVREGSRILNDQCRVSKIDINGRKDGEIRIMCPSQTLSLKLSERGEGVVSLKDYGSAVDDYFDKGTKAVSELVSEFGSEKKDIQTVTYGEEALLAQIELARSVGKHETMSKLMQNYVDKYPRTFAANKIRRELMDMDKVDYSLSFGSVVVSNRFYTISVVDFNGSKREDRKVDFALGGMHFSLGEGQEGTITTAGGGGQFVAVTRVTPNEARIEYYEKDNTQRISRRQSVTVAEGGYATLAGKELHVKEIHVDGIAHISLLPEVRPTKTEADFTFRIGIEKRNIKLSPDKTEERIKNLNESIKKWEEINSRLNNLVKAWKGACFATSGLLMVKSVVSGFGGEGLARQKVMEEYKLICAEKYPGMSSTECYNKLAPQINSRVSEMTSALNAVNRIMDDSISRHETKGLFGEGTITDQAKYVEDLRRQLGEGWGIEVEGVRITASDLDTAEAVRSALLYENLRGTSSGEIAKKELERELRNLALYKKSEDERKKAATDLGGITPDDVVTLTDRGTEYFHWTGKNGENYVNLGLNADSKIQIATYHGERYLLVLGTQGNDGNMGVSKAYKREGDVWSSTPLDDKDKNGIFGRFVFSSVGAGGRCSNPWPAGAPRVVYYESGNVRGLPAIVPFNTREGWYVMVPESKGTFLEDSPKGYTAAGDVSYFKICNIGPNKLMERGMGDDLCQTFDVNSAGTVDRFIPCPSLDSRKVRELYVSAREAVRQAATQRDRSIVTILGERFAVGPPMSEVTAVECQDFMSPEDCKLMFNVCDPVVCPPSRCNFGGKYPVSDVIQTGIIGSLVLCLPNAAEGIAVPVCVSGVAAGIDSFTSILRAHRDCLQRSYERGEMVGICDEITSIYMCEFFWRQLSPLLDMLIPRFVESLYSGRFQRTRGGGEYMLVQKSWDNLQKSIDYFQNVYAPNVFRVFRMRNVQEAGGEVCRAFVGTSFPTSAEAIDNLLEPESPSQFYAHFSERLFSEATVPSTSHYKVYYHIYAGKDVGAQYRIYLKNPPAYSYYAANPTVTVKTGYIARGDYASESIDFTAPSGYKELCVVINAREECGFTQVTSSMGIDYLTKKYTEEQASKVGITTERECISGSPSVLPMANLNLQAGFEDSVNPEIALKGIVRVCASNSPGQGLDLTRWRDVGYCGDVNMRCWLDIESVKDDLSKIEALEGRSLSVLDQNRGLIENAELGEAGVAELLAKASEQMKLLQPADLGGGDRDEKIKKIIGELDKVVGTIGAQARGGAGTNKQRAEALHIKASIYRMIVVEKFKGVVFKVESPPAPRVGDDDGCREDKDCPEDKWRCVDKKCVECRVNTDCVEGGTCVDGGCIFPKKDDGFVCEEGKAYGPFGIINTERVVYLKHGEKWKFGFDEFMVFEEITSDNTRVLFDGTRLNLFASKKLQGGCDLIEEIQKKNFEFLGGDGTSVNKVGADNEGSSGDDVDDSKEGGVDELVKKSESSGSDSSSVADGLTRDDSVPPEDPYAYGVRLVEEEKREGDVSSGGLLEYLRVTRGRVKKLIRAIG